MATKQETFQVRMPTSSKFMDLTGQKFDRLTVVSFAGFTGKSATWNVRCKCGTEKAVMAMDLRSGKVRSCGCIRRKHGKSTSPIYSAWRAMMARCNNPNTRWFERYGGRGIKVCDRWLNSFEAFAADMGDRPSSNHSIDRIDNDGNYEPGNCRSATRREQSQNRRSTRFVSFMGRKMATAEWARELGICRGTLRRRLEKYPVEVALTLKKQRGGRCLVSK